MVRWSNFAVGQYVVCGVSAGDYELGDQRGVNNNKNEEVLLKVAPTQTRMPTSEWLLPEAWASTQ